ncbi:indolepyruvate ferredoxin oxidoreductase subunit alpha [Terasakiella sp. A23]|uniref:indolepyruvate ferredoxin oxidoreductase subunit alpha n=1 Tax=Terasakiella sp. FCG-A23 TaxID=3080561 RepID=UPI002954D340|nr:indolepyruvate ferredoxin oxidoreductase subunit alpha [Terasakiella sp. A23]MDV7339500.1 indolepyruvate ferredoxin oxidoreductase subunit alpha [Terasakiella sp. A23]
MNAIVKAHAQTKHLLSGNEALARGVWEAGVNVATAYPGTPSTEILENLALYPDIHAQWSVNEKVSLEVAIGACVVGSRAFCAMKHVGVNVASDALMSQTLAGVNGGLVIAIADDVGLSSSQNEQDSRFWGRFGHLPILEPCDSQEAYEMGIRAFELSEQFGVPVLIRMTTRVCHVKGIVEVGERQTYEHKGFLDDPTKWVMVPANAKNLLKTQGERDIILKNYANECDLNRIEEGSDTRVGFVTSGPAYLHVKETFPHASIFKMGLSCPVPIEKIRRFSETVDKLIVVEETEPLVETELLAAGVQVHGKDILPKTGELSPLVIEGPIRKLLGETVEELEDDAMPVFPRPPTMCVACPHLSPYYCLSKIHKKIRIAGDIGCYTLGAGHPWKALDTTTCMGASISMALGMTLGASDEDKDKPVVAVIGDSTFLHMGLQPLLDVIYNQGNVTVMLLDNRTTGMTGGQEHAGTGFDINGNEAPRADFVKIVEAVGVKPERIRKVNPYEMPEMFKVIKEEIKQNEPSVIITDQPCVLTDRFVKHEPLEVIDGCTGCGNCLSTGCPAIIVTHRETETRKSGKEVEKAFVKIESIACTGCDLCVKTCGPDVIKPINFRKEFIA